MRELSDDRDDLPKPERATGTLALDLADALLVGSIGVLVAAIAHALFHYVLFIEQLMRAII